ncbi:MAG: hypothetical protein NVS2B1_19560 [Bradyrhizobium sp.]
MHFAALSQTVCVTCQAPDRAARAERTAKPPKHDRENPGRRPAHLAWVRSLPCSVGNAECSQTIHAHHVRNGADGGMGMKPDDLYTVPLCSLHHNELHTRGRLTFEGRHQVNLRHVAAGLALRSPHMHREPDAES